MLRLTRRRYLVRNLLRPQGYREELVKALPRELIKASLRGPIWYPVYLGDLEEGLNVVIGRLDHAKGSAYHKR